MNNETLNAAGELECCQQRHRNPASMNPTRNQHPFLSRWERIEVRARPLLTRLKQLLVINWRQKSAARSQLKLAVEDVLDAGLLRVYSPNLYQQKCSAAFEHIYESYPERDAGVYAEAS